MTKQPDTRIVYSISGTWWDSIDKIAKTPSGLPYGNHDTDSKRDRGAVSTQSTRRSVP